MEEMAASYVVGAYPRVLSLGSAVGNRPSQRICPRRSANSAPMPRAVFTIDNSWPVGIIANMKAELLQRDRMDFDDGAILEMVIWRVPTPVKGSTHHYKYRLFYGRPGKRIVGYDNERPKGDHRHVGESEAPYVFTAVETLVRDFLTDVSRQRSADEKGNDPNPPR
jgi:hypothetical protein